MPSIRAIIENATPGPWETTPCSNGGLILSRGETSQELQIYPSTDATFIATFDPEHIALMEAVASASRFGIEPYDRDGECFYCQKDVTEQHDYSCPWQQLQDYRKERGLDA